MYLNVRHGQGTFVVVSGTFDTVTIGCRNNYGTEKAAFSQALIITSTHSINPSVTV